MMNTRTSLYENATAFANLMLTLADMGRCQQAVSFHHRVAGLRTRQKAMQRMESDRLVQWRMRHNMQPERCELVPAIMKMSSYTSREGNTDHAVLCCADLVSPNLVSHHWSRRSCCRSQSRSQCLRVETSHQCNCYEVSRGSSDMFDQGRGSCHSLRHSA